MLQGIMCTHSLCHRPHGQTWLWAVVWVVLAYYWFAATSLCSLTLLHLDSCLGWADVPRHGEDDTKLGSTRAPKLTVGLHQYWGTRWTQGAVVPLSPCGIAVPPQRMFLSTGKVFWEGWWCWAPSLPRPNIYRGRATWVQGQHPPSWLWLSAPTPKRSLVPKQAEKNTAAKQNCCLNCFFH